MKAIEQFFPVVLFIILHKVDEILKCGLSSGGFEQNVSMILFSFLFCFLVFLCKCSLNSVSL